MTVGETKTFTLGAQDAYGPLNVEAIQEVPKERFPDDFEIPVSDTQAYKQFGNAVVPQVIEDIYDSIVSYIG